MAPSATNTLERVALAPINVNVNVNVSSPLQARKMNSAASLRNCLFPLTPSNTPRPFLPKSASVLVKSETHDKGALSGYRITNNRNVKADLAATKLKLRLQLAFYKLKQQKEAQVGCTPPLRKASPALWKALALNSTSALETKRFPLLNTVASQKTSAMRLYHIKSLSSFHNSFPNLLPLRMKSCKLPSVHKILKTPIKAAARRHAGLGTSNSDETIDETADETIDFTRKNEDLLSSSPIRHGSFGTPNSFLVAKSLLLLGLARF